MKPMINLGSLITLGAVLTLGACTNMNTPGSTSSSGTAYPQSTSASTAYSGYGVVQSIELVKVNNTGIAGSGIGVGTIAGAVVGGIVGNQMGGGQGKTATTVIGAAGGAYAGHELEKRSQQQSDAYKFSIRMDNGSYQTLTQTSSADIRVGDRVQIDNGVARRY
jgi:outer membrane lipoprotein SlyB